MEVGLLTLAQKDSLVGVMYVPDVFSNPIEDCNDNWVISTQEIALTTDPAYEFVKNLTLITYCQKIGPGPQPPIE